MSRKDDSFRIHIRLNRFEYVDLVTDLELLSGADRTGRVRFLLRRGFAPERSGSISQTASEGMIDLSAYPVATTHKESFDAFDAFDLNPANFIFGKINQ